MGKKTTGLILGTLAMLGSAAPALAIDEQVNVERSTEPASTVGVVAKDALYGGIAGAAIGGGILLIQDDGWDGRTMGIATGAGLLAGAALGFFDAASQHPAATAEVSPNADARPIERAQASRDSGLPAPTFSLQHSGRF